MRRKPDLFGTLPYLGVVTIEYLHLIRKVTNALTNYRMALKKTTRFKKQELIVVYYEIGAANLIDSRNFK